MRLTEIKKENGFYVPADYRHGLTNLITNICHKLGELEDIEEELGIDLVKLIKCIRNEKGIWKKDLAGYLYNTRCMLACYFGKWQIYDKELIFELKDYGKTWALTREELEK